MGGSSSNRHVCVVVCSVDMCSVKKVISIFLDMVTNKSVV